MARGFPVSFALVHDSFGAIPGDLPFGYENLVVFEPANCDAAPYEDSEEVLSVGAPTVFRARGNRCVIGSSGVVG